MGRFAMFVRDANRGIKDAELVKRVILGHAIMMFARGVPTIYYGDEQGFVSDSGDQGARETMFAGRTGEYLDNDLAGTDATVADANFDVHHPIFRAIAQMAAIRSSEAAIRRGSLLTRYVDATGGPLVISRLDPEGRGEIVIAFNPDRAARQIAFPVDGRARSWTALAGVCPAGSTAAGAYRLDVPALGYVVCKAEY